jgi:beta-lactamase regulating signal transducer with metallopeptidase domain
MMPEVFSLSVTPHLFTGLGMALFGIIVRSSVVFGLAWLVIRLWSQASSARRHLVWVLACVLALALPATQTLVPRWRIDMPRVWSQGVMDNILIRPAKQITAARVVKNLHPVPPDWRSLLFLSLVGVWGIGTACVAASLLRSHRRVRRLLGQTVACDSNTVLGVVRASAAAMGIRKIPTVRYHATTIPMVCGIRSPVIVLPVVAGEWAHARLCDVVLHEMAHIARHDIVTQMMGSVSCAVYWFNPLVWIAARGMRTEREVACDDRVLATGTLPSRYATHLLELAHTFQTPAGTSLAALAFARRSQIKIRLGAIIDPCRQRSIVPSSHRRLATMLTAIIAYPIATVTPIGRPVSADPSSHKLLSQEMTSMKGRTAVALGASILGVASAAHAQSPSSTSTADTNGVNVEIISSSFNVTPKIEESQNSTVIHVEDGNLTLHSVDADGNETTATRINVGVDGMVKLLVGEGGWKLESQEEPSDDSDSAQTRKEEH